MHSVALSFLQSLDRRLAYFALSHFGWRLESQSHLPSQSSIVEWEIR